MEHKSPIKLDASKLVGFQSIPHLPRRLDQGQNSGSGEKVSIKVGAKVGKKNGTLVARKP